MNAFSIQYFRNIKKIYREHLNENEKGIFIDCGGYDGCSAIKFIMINPDFDCVTFEPNPLLWKYYESVPTKLIKKAVYNHNKRTDMIIDKANYLGTTIIKSKRVMTEPTPEIIKVECIRLSDFIRTLSSKYDKIVLKLDVEGAEYEILEDLISENQIRNIHKLYSEFHWHKCDTKIYTEYRHELLIHRLVDILPVCEWDSTLLSVESYSNEYQEQRNNLVKNHFKNLEKYQKLNIGKIYE